MKPWEKYAAAEPAAEGPWTKYAAPVESAAPGELPGASAAAANPQADIRIGPISLGTMQGETDSGFSPAAALISSGRLLDRVDKGIDQAKTEYMKRVYNFVPGFQELAVQHQEKLNKMAADEDANTREFKKLETVHPGSTLVGEAGTLAVAPMATIPVVGALEYGSPEERAKRAALAYAGNKIVKAAGGYLAKAPERAATKQTQNAVRDAAVLEAREAGYVVPPSASEGGVLARTMEGISGKAKTEQRASIKNQPVTDVLAKKAIGLAEDEAITPAVLNQVRKEAYDVGYKPIADMPLVRNDQVLASQVAQVMPASVGGAVKNPAEAEINDLLQRVANHPQWTGQQMISDIRSLRSQSSKNFKAFDDPGKQELARAQIEVADLLEGLAERNVIANGGSPGAVAALRESRKRIAKSHTVEDALDEATGHVDATKVAAMYKRGAPLEGELKKIATFGGSKGTAKSARIPEAGWANPITTLDAFGTAALGAAGGGIPSLAWPAARIGSRELILSQMLQKYMNPSYDTSLAVRGGAMLLDNPAAPALASMYGATR